MSQKAIVVGAGIAGLLAAAALSQAAPEAEVLVLERDALPETPRNRRGVPHGQHAHLLMAGGLAAMEDLFPVSVRDRLVAAGAHQIPFSNGTAIRTADGGWFPRWKRNSPHVITCTRALLEWVLRQLLLESGDNVTIRQAGVEGLLGSAERVHGVRVSGPDPASASELEADIVVDATGRGSRSLRWLEDIGVNGVTEEKIDSGLTNATRIYRVPAGAESFPLTVVQANPYSARPGRSAMVLPIEGNRWMVSAAGTRGGEPPQDPEGFLEYALGLPHPIVGQLISGAEALTDVAVSRSTSNVRRYLEKAPHWPERFVVLGDAFATFNPAYGQGMSVAALGAREFAQELQRNGLAGPGLSRRVLRRAAKHVDSAWATAVAMDILYPDVRGDRNPTAADRLAAWYSRRLTRAATGSFDAALALWEVTGLQAPATRLFRPKALLAALTGPLVRQSSEPPLTPSELQILDGLRTAAAASTTTEAPQ
ncbi:NAD(P)/FAD-dependent oxidoreductase [Streptomyces sp. V3I7]|uniref:NAD(P)/FAD-dependent oxidoreductase n=1 Tax=Streptomyces sp. V3I7 TaxID=3042278 RepID=UPI00277F714B|nr:NAD(P)-binding protein [Streptomyces sp. V3I7]MDQ0988895.1 2-polyprenyl-6-methoxyphenol hydroxylase-like FAD-dependent oxidoreductase [Streptomyces sp. V3I7]